MKTVLSVMSELFNPHFESNDSLHLFDPWVAKHYGLNAAILYQYIGWVCHKRRSFSITKERLLEKFPYIGRDGITAALAKLLRHKRGSSAALLSRTEDHVNPTYNLTRKAVQIVEDEEQETKLHAFDPAMAVRYGVPAAIVFDDIAKWAIYNKDSNINNSDLPGEHYRSPKAWADMHPYLSLSTVERAFKKLREVGEINLTGYEKGRIPSWSLLCPEFPERYPDRVYRWQALHAFGYERRKYKNAKKVKEVLVYKEPQIKDPDEDDRSVEILRARAEKRRNSRPKTNYVV